MKEAELVIPVACLFLVPEPFYLQTQKLPIHWRN